MSLCDTCVAPGMCCKQIIVNVATSTILEAIVSLTAYWPEENILPLPFVFSKREDELGVTVECDWLTADGRCGNYDLRPHYPCRTFEIGSDSLCAYGILPYGLCPERPRTIRYFPSDAVTRNIIDRNWPFNFVLPASDSK